MDRVLSSFEMLLQRFQLYYNIILAFTTHNRSNSSSIDTLREKIERQQHELNLMKQQLLNDQESHNDSVGGVVRSRNHMILKREIESIEQRLNHQIEVLQEYDRDVQNMQQSTSNVSAQLIMQFVVALVIVGFLFYCLLWGMGVV